MAQSSSTCSGYRIAQDCPGLPRTAAHLRLLSPPIVLLKQSEPRLDLIQSLRHLRWRLVTLAKRDRCVDIRVLLLLRPTEQFFRARFIRRTYPHSACQRVIPPHGPHCVAQDRPSKLRHCWKDASNEPRE